MKKNTKIISYYTKNTCYEEEVKFLISSCKKLNIKIEIENRSCFGSWSKNCCFKPTFILKKLLALKKPILWVDADSVFLKKPVEIYNFNCDLALWINEDLPKNHPSRIISAVIYADYNEKTIEFIKRWEAECNSSKDPDVWDQVCLRNIYNNHQDININCLPKSYCSIFDKPQKNAVIMQYQASRFYKKFIDKEIASFMDIENFQIKELRKIRENFIK